MLSDRDRAILAFEAQFSTHSGVKEEQIGLRFGLRPVRYYQAVNRILDDADALRERPQDVRRLLRIRNSRSRARAARRLIAS